MMNIVQAQLKKHITIGLSGGVDSSVAALLLKEQGYQVRGVFMKNWMRDDKDDGRCQWEDDVDDCLKVCEKLDISLDVIDLSQEYWDKVFKQFLSEYQNGLTPNPDILCNQYIKFRAFVDHVTQHENTLIASGHYANLHKDNEEVLLLKGKDENKDQSYFLYRLAQHQIQNIIFPLGGMLKADVRQLAKKVRFPNHAKPDSVGICFIGELPFQQFLMRYLPRNPGNMLNIENKEHIGTHPGAHLFTIGQRKGLKIGGHSKYGGSPWYVVEKNVQENLLWVTNNKQHPLLYRNELLVENPHWICPQLVNKLFQTQDQEASMHCMAKIRYRQNDQICKIIRQQNGELKIIFQEPQWAVAPGQHIVFYHKAICLGGGVIPKQALIP